MPRDDVNVRRKGGGGGRRWFRHGPNGNTIKKEKTQCCAVQHQTQYCTSIRRRRAYPSGSRVYEGRGKEGTQLLYRKKKKEGERNEEVAIG